MNSIQDWLTQNQTAVAGMLSFAAPLLLQYLHSRGIVPIRFLGPLLTGIAQSPSSPPPSINLDLLDPGVPQSVRQAYLQELLKQETKPTPPASPSPAASGTAT
jgi:hypothetical protein